MYFSMIVAHDLNNAIGKNGDMLWHIPSDLLYFRKQTLDKTIIMGRKTFESIKCQPLLRRKNIVMTRDKNFDYPGIIIANSLTDVFANLSTEEEVMVIGGEEIYKIFMPFTKKLYITKILMVAEESDSYFPKYNEKEWKLLYKKIIPYKYKYGKKAYIRYIYERWRPVR